MGTVVGEEDAVKVGVDNAEEISSSAVDDLGSEKSEKVKSDKETSRRSLGSYVVDTLNSSVKSATGFLPVSLGGEVGEAGSDCSPHSDEVTNDRTESPIVSIGDDRADEKAMAESSSEGSSIVDTEERVAVVDPVPEEGNEDNSQLEIQLESVHGEEETPEVEGDGPLESSVETHNFASKVSPRPEISEEVEEIQLVKGEVLLESSGKTHSVASIVSPEPETQSVASNVSPEPEIIEEEEEIQPVKREGLLESSERVQSVASDATPEPEIQEEDVYTRRYPFGYVDDWPHFSYNDKPVSSLRRRSRSFPKGSKDYSSSVNALLPSSSSRSEESGASSVPGTQAAFESQNSPESRVSWDTMGKTQLQSEDDDVNSEVEDRTSLTRTESEFRSGYYPEVGIDNDASSASSGAAITGKDMWKGNSPSRKKDEWQEVSSSGDMEWRGPISELRHRREVYRMPRSEDEGDENEGESAAHLLFHPAGFILLAVGYQVKLIVHVLAIAYWLLKTSVSTISRPLNMTVAAKDRATGFANGAVNQTVGVMSFVCEGVSQAGPAISNLSKKTFWGCLSAAYVIFMLGLLLIPVIFVDLILINRVVDEPVVIRKTLEFDYTRAKPVALFPLFSPKEMERVKSLPPERAVKMRVLPAWHKFHITAVLTLPESEYNMNLGIFQVTTELLSAQDQVLLRSSKPCRLRFSSLPVRIVRTVIFAVPLLMGFSTETQKVEIRLLETHEKATPTASVRIFLEAKASYRDGVGVPDIYDAAILLESSLPWPQSILGGWKWTFYVWNGICLFLFEVSLVLCCCRQLIIPGFGRQKDSEDKIVLGLVNDERANSSTRKARSKTEFHIKDGTSSASGATDFTGT